VCGRFASNLTWQQLHEIYGIVAPQPSPATPDSRPLYNIAPTQTVPVIRLNSAGQRELALLRWGLIPSWSKDAKIGYRLFNARAETVATAPSFRAAFKRRRCLVPATGFYEWKRLDGDKQPYFIGLRDRAPLAFAGLWERWDKGEAPLETVTIITGEPNALVAEIYDRMPVILDPADYEAWLHAGDTAIPQALLQPFPSQLMAAYPVGKRVNSAKNDDPTVMEPMP